MSSFHKMLLFTDPYHLHLHVVNRGKGQPWLRYCLCKNTHAVSSEGSLCGMCVMTDLIWGSDLIMSNGLSVNSLQLKWMTEILSVSGRAMNEPLISVIFLKQISKASVAHKASVMV